MSATKGRLTVSLGTIQNNYRLLVEKTKPAVCSAVVKANAYGLGIEKIAPALQQAGATDFFVATLDEGVELRDILPNATVYILNGFQNGDERELLEKNLIPVINHQQASKNWQDLAQLTGKKLPCIIHVYTGLNRLGFNDKDFKNDFNGLAVKYLMSHLACADTPEHPMNVQQRKRFLTAAKQMPETKLSLAASDGIFCGPDFHFDMVRPGAALYGINPTPSLKNPMQNCVSLSVPVLQTRIVEQDGTAGYAATSLVKRGQRVAAIAIGYADGFLRGLSNKGKVFFNGAALPVLGRVSMDIIIVDLSALPENALKPGDRVEVFGPDQNPDAMAETMGMIGYEVLTALGQRFERVYTP